MPIAPDPVGSTFADESQILADRDSAVAIFLESASALSRDQTIESSEQQTSSETAPTNPSTLSNSGMLTSYVPLAAISSAELLDQGDAFHTVATIAPNSSPSTATMLQQNDFLSMPGMDTFIIGGDSQPAPALGGLASASYVLTGGKWGPSQSTGNTGGVVTWGLVANGTSVDSGITTDIQTAFGVTITNVSAAANSLYSGFEAQLKQAFAAWSAIANIDFIQVVDGGGSIGTGTMADIRISALPIDGSSGVLAFTYFPNQGPISGELFFDSGDSAFYDSHSLFLVAAHEIGHAIGLDHENGVTALMNPIYNGSLNGLQSDDIAGAQAIYGGAQPGAAKAYSIPAGQTSFTILDGIANLAINANSSGDSITGSSQNETINGGIGNDTINGGGGADTMAGGAGNDTYVVDGTSDVVTENSGAGTDTVQSSISYTLGANVENLTLTGSVFLNGTGNALNNVVTGNSGANTLDGGAGADTLIGGAGDDVYIVDNASDVVTENAADGNDWIYSATTSYTLPTNVEILTLTANAPADGTGNGIDNVLFGNIWNNILDGLSGGDFMAGGAGDDAYYVDSASDVVYEKAGEGGDTVDTVVNYQLFAGSEVEALVLLDSGGGINGVGSDTDNLIQGNNFDNVIVGRGGADRLWGFGGADRFIFNTTDGHDTINDYSRGQGDYLDVRVSGYTTVAQILAVATDNGTSTTIQFNATDAITLVGIHVNQLTAADFLIIPPGV